MKYYLIVGASSGIGKKTAQLLSSNDTTLILVARREAELQATADSLSGKSIIYPCDLTQEGAVDYLYNDLQLHNIKLNGLVYCAGIFFKKPAKLVTQSELETMYRINVFAFYELCRKFYSAKISVKGASIVGVSSYASISCEQGLSAYSMTKASMNVMIQILSKEFAKRKIRINAVLPAHVQSKMGSLEDLWTEDELALINSAQSYGIIPIEQVVHSIKFLLSEKASYITGALLPIGANFHK